METFLEGVLAVVFVIVIACAVALLIAWPVQLLWNEVMPEIFGLKAITFWQALMLSLLCSLLFKSSCSSSKD